MRTSNWDLGIRTTVSHNDVVLRLGFGIAGPNGENRDVFGVSPLYLDLMQRTSSRPNKKAVGFSDSYDFEGIGIQGLSGIVTFAAGFDGELDGDQSDAQELDVTIDYRLKHGWLESFWLRVRGSWLNDESAESDGTEIPVVLRYDLPII